MNRVLIIGGGFAGLAAANTLKNRHDIDVLLIDQKPTSDFLPMLPDVLSERIAPELITYPLEDLARSARFRFLHDTVTAIDPANRVVTTPNRALEYDHLIIAAGTGTNFYGQGEIERRAHKLDSAADARNILALLKQDRHDVLVVIGGGYTGVEVASNLWAFCRRSGQRKHIILCERTPAILAALPENFRKYAVSNLARMNVDVRTQTTLAKIEGDNVTLSPGETLSRAAVIWAAGVQTPAFVRGLPAPKNNQGRVEVDPCLRISPRCYGAGDTALFRHRAQPLRMSVQFAITQGRLAARNILRDLQGKKPRPFRPMDPGYLIPMANNRSCGLVLRVPLKGLLPTGLHYLLCILRSRGLTRKLRMLAALSRSV